MTVLDIGAQRFEISLDSRLLVRILPAKSFSCVNNPLPLFGSTSGAPVAHPSAPPIEFVV